MTHSTSDRHASISDLATFQSKRLGVPIDRAAGDLILASIKDANPILVQGGQRFYSAMVGTKEVVVGLGPIGRIDTVKQPHPAGIVTNQALSYAMKADMGLSMDDFKHIYDLAERAEDRKDEGSGRGSAVVSYNGDDYEVVIGLRDRLILRIDKLVFRYATMHAIRRAKERYGLVLTASAAHDIIEKLRHGEYVSQETGRVVRNPLDMGTHEKAHHIRATVSYDCEQFTVIYDPETDTIVTVTPPGDYDPARKQAGA